MVSRSVAVNIGIICIIFWTKKYLKIKIKNEYDELTKF